jgi:hypothetical protein
MPFDRSDLLRQARYSEAQFIPLTSYGTGSNATTSSDTYTDAFPATITIRLVPAGLFPDGSFEARLDSQLDPSGDQVDVRLRDVANGDTYAEDVAAATAGGTANYTLGPTTVATDNPDRMAAVRLQIRNADNATSVSIVQPTLSFGVIP